MNVHRVQLPHLGWGGATIREFWASYPADWYEQALNGELPVIVFLHGGNQNAQFFMDTVMELPKWWGSGYMALPNPQMKAIAIAPQGIALASNSAWNSGHFANDVRLLDVDDTGFILECLDRLELALLDAYANRIQPYTGGDPLTQVMDKSRLMLVGFSNGGQMAYRLVTEVGAAGWTVTAVAVFGTAIGGWHRDADAMNPAAPPWGVTWTPTVIPSLLHVHGNLDPVVNVDMNGISFETQNSIGAQVVTLVDFARSDICGQDSAAVYDAAAVGAGWAVVAGGAPPTTWPAFPTTSFTVTDYDSTGGATADHQVCFAKVGGTGHVVPSFAGEVTAEFFQTWGGL